ncbi:MAG: hypothetical protein ACO4CU_13335 [Ilumatobacteraceae bacterium]
MDRPDWQPPTSSEPGGTLAPPPMAQTVPVSPAGSGKRRSGAVLGAVVAVLALGAAGVFAVQRLGGASDGGAASADELGASFLRAIEAEDVLGVIDTLSPGERDSLGGPFVEFVSELRRLEVFDESVDLSAVAGFDVELADERVVVRRTNVDDIVGVEMSAEVTVRVDGASVPVGGLIEDRIDADEMADLRGTSSTETDDLEIRLAAVEEGGRWYFSIFHTIAELAREAADVDDIPEVGIVPDGADSPEGAVDRLLDRVGDLDLSGVIAVLDPAEAAALQRYAPLFVDDAQSVVDDIPLRWRVDVREFRAEGSGDERTVLFDAIGITGDLDGVDFSLLVRDGCVRVVVDGETIEQCGTEPEGDVEDLLAEEPDLEEFVDVVTEAFADVEPIGLELRRRDGAWFVSPFATGTEAVLTLMRALDADELAAIVDAGSSLAEDASDVVLDVLDGGTIDDTFDDTFDDSFDDTFDDAFDDSFGESTVDECYGIEDAASAAACFQQAIDAGEIDPRFAPVALLHPECGIAEYSWEGRWYEVSDEEFTALVRGAVPCFEELVVAGEVERWVIPFEVLYVDCFEGRNWFTAFEADYNDRVSACIDATPIDD